jgi:hypothetical protein
VPTGSQCKINASFWKGRRALYKQKRRLLEQERQKKRLLADKIVPSKTEVAPVHYRSGGSMKLNACILLLAHMVYL